MTIAAIITRGFGPPGSIPLVVTAGYLVGPPGIPNPNQAVGGAGSGIGGQVGIDYDERARIAAEVRAIYKRINQSQLPAEIVERVAEIVEAEPAGSGASVLPPEAEVDWAAIAEDFSGLVEFYRLLVELVALQDDEDVVRALMLADQEDGMIIMKALQ